MKPRHQLSRTPPNMKKTPANEISIQKDDTIEFESQPCHKSIEETIIISPNAQGILLFYPIKGLKKSRKLIIFFYYFFLVIYLKLLIIYMFYFL